VLRFNLSKLDSNHPPKIIEVGPHTYAVTGLGHPDLISVNAGFVLTPSGVIFIDSGMSVSDGAFLWQSACKLTRACKKAYLILTHHHSDHVFGMRVFRKRNAEIIAHASVREFLENDQGRYKAFIIEQYLNSDYARGDAILGDVELALPDHLVDEDTMIEVDGEEIHLLATPGHVKSEMCVYIPGSKVLFAGDTIYEGMRPNTRFAGEAEIASWVSQLQRLLEMDIHVVVPGHGKISDKSLIRWNLAQLRLG
jgi:glyoxylase-like metal-dependent hydrolase (beta-lactamase superfamily II)